MNIATRWVSIANVSLGNAAAHSLARRSTIKHRYLCSGNRYENVATWSLPAKSLCKKTLSKRPYCIYIYSNTEINEAIKHAVNKWYRTPEVNSRKQNTINLFYRSHMTTEYKTEETIIYHNYYCYYNFIWITILIEFFLLFPMVVSEF